MCEFARLGAAGRGLEELEPALTHELHTWLDQRLLKREKWQNVITLLSLKCYEWINLLFMLKAEGLQCQLCPSEGALHERQHLH